MPMQRDFRASALCSSRPKTIVLADTVDRMTMLFAALHESRIGTNGECALVTFTTALE
jgi:hypothetical protein